MKSWIARGRAGVGVGVGPAQRCILYLSVAALTSGMFVNLAISQTTERALSDNAATNAVRSKMRRLDYESFGLDLDLLLDDWSDAQARAFWGSFKVFARMNVDIGHDSNVFREPTDTVSSSFATISPAIAMRSDWERGELNMSLRGDFSSWDVRSSEKAANIEFKVDGTRELETAESVRGIFQVGHSFLPRDNSNDLGSAFDLITYQWLAAGAEYKNKRAEPTVWSLGANFEGSVYNDVNGLSTDYLDVNIYTVDAKMGYEIGTDSVALIRPSIEYTDYTQTANNINDAVRYGLSAGGNFFPSPLTAINGFVGLSYKDYIASTFKSSGSLIADLNGLWNATPLITLRGAAYVNDENSVVGGASSALTARISGMIDYEMFDNVIFGLKALYENVDYRDTGRVDDKKIFVASVDYFMNEYLFLRGEASIEDRDSTDPLERFENNQIMVRFGTKLCCLLDNKVINAF